MQKITMQKEVFWRKLQREEVSLDILRLEISILIQKSLRKSDLRYSPKQQVKINIKQYFEIQTPSKKEKSLNS